MHVTSNAVTEEGPLRFADQRPGIMALLALLGAAPDLPVADIKLSPVAGAHFTQGLTVSLHNAPGRFEPWRESLRIDPAAVVLTRYGTDFSTLTAFTHAFGAPVELIAFVPAPWDDSPRQTAEPLTASAVR